jgi:hypothetical protein
MVKAIMNNPLHDELPEAGASRRKIDRVRVAMKSCFTSRPVSRLIIPIVLGSHFFVLCMDCSFSTPEFIAHVKLYDSLKRRTRHVHPDVAGIVEDVNFFVGHFILHERENQDRRLSDNVLIRGLEYCDCPIQLNGYDCGLFAIGMVLHLVDGKNLTEETFKQENITDLRQKMATFLGRMALVNWTRQVNLSVAVFHNCVEVASWIPSASR